VTLLLIVAIIALTPYTTKCSPNKIIFPGADAIDCNMLLYGTNYLFDFIITNFGFIIINVISH
jgi:hypothetical protein